jgi:outer membrane lipoprotein carrier protein
MNSTWRVVLLLVALAGSVFAEALPLPEVLAKMEAQQQALQDVRFDFVQTSKQGDFPAQRVTGEVQAKKPQRLRVEQKSPDKQTLISDGKTLWLYMPGQKQQLKGDWNAWLKKSRFPSLLLDMIGSFTPERWRRDYEVFFGGYENALYELQFKPKRPDVLPLTIWISEDNFLPARGQLNDQGSRIEVELKKVQINTGIKDGAFKSRVPSGTAEIPVTF